ncbi:MAG: phosphoribosylformylglycinamidine cyclo-ligase [Acidimicrobiales bacterium]
MSGSASGKTSPTGPLTYARAGVDIEGGEAAVRAISDLVASTFRPEVRGDIGGFGGLFSLASGRWQRPVLVAGTDGVGTKAVVAQQTGRLDTIGIDLVAMCVDDLVCLGAEPLFFLDYVATGKVSPAEMVELVGGVARGCRLAGCSLIGGEMAEHPGVMEPGQFDLVGFAVGVVEEDAVITGSKLRPGHVLVGLGSPGLRSNGYSLARRALLDVGGLALDGPAWAGADRSLADELLEPSVIYAPAVLGLLNSGQVEIGGIAHITGGGICGNLARILPTNCDAEIHKGMWPVPAIFDEIQRHGDIEPSEMEKVFNLGLGMVMALPDGEQQVAIDVLALSGIQATVVGRLVAGTGQARMILARASHI